MDEASKPQLEVLSIHAAGNWSGGDQARLGDLTAQAMLKYSVKDYNTAAELYSQATELQAEINGEMSSLNADLLYAYGRCLYHVAVRNSDVLGSKVAGEKREDKVKSLGHRNREPKRDNNGTGDDQTRITAEVSQQVVEEKDRMIESVEGLDNKSKPYFQFTGDENFDDSDGEEETAGGNDENEEADDEDDDFVNAYEVLDLARVLLLRRLEDAQDSKSKGSGNGKVVGDSQIAKQLKERLADTHDLQAEISLEGERFPEAVLDLKAALALKQELFPQESSLLAEAHYKLSLALEFSSVTQPKNEDDSALTGEEAHVDEGMREDAAKEMEAAIASCKLRIEQEEARLHASAAATGGTGNPKLKKEDIKNVKEMIRDMEQRLVELRQPPVSINDPTGTGAIDGDNPLSGVLGSILGGSPAAQKARLEEASNGANDLTDLVKRKKPANGEQAEAYDVHAKSNGKRKYGFVDENMDVGVGKKARVLKEDED